MRYLSDFVGTLIPDISLGSLFHGTVPYSVPWFPPRQSADPGRLSGDVEYEDIYKYHLRPAADVHANILIIPDAVVSGSGFVRRKDEIIAPSEYYPSYLSRSFGEKLGTTIWTKHFASSLRVVSSDAPLIVASHPNFVYGHFLLEMLGRIYVARHMLSSGVSARLAWTTSCPAWVKRILAVLFSDEEIFWFNHDEEEVHSDYVIVAPPLQDNYRFHPYFNNAASLLSSTVGGSPDSIRYDGKLYLSRLHHTKAKQGIKNQLQLEGYLRDRGFYIFSPEQHPLEVQMSVYRQARLVVSDYNSSLHNSIFMPFGCAFLVTNWFNWYQHTVAALRRQGLHFVLPADGVYRRWTERGKDSAFYEVDLNRISDGIDFLGSGLGFPTYNQE